MNTLDEFASYYATHGDTEATHQFIWHDFERRFRQNPMLVEQRAQHTYGMGYNQFSWMWHLIVESLPARFSFLEIGVYRGQVIQLIALLAKMSYKQAKVVGCSTFDGRDIEPKNDGSWGDDRSQSKDFDYVVDVRAAFARMELPQPHLVRGDSTDSETIAEVRKLGPYDVVFIDGGHTEQIVRSDLACYGRMVKPGGLLVMDDASCSLKLPSEPYIWPGVWSVANVVDKMLPPLGPNVWPDHDLQPIRWVHLGAVAHDRIWRRMP
jgi:hypothetical protein